MRIKLFCYTVSCDSDLSPRHFKTRVQAEAARAAEEGRCGDIFEIQIRTDVDGKVLSLERWSDDIEMPIFKSGWPVTERTTP